MPWNRVAFEEYVEPKEMSQTRGDARVPVIAPEVANHVERYSIIRLPTLLGLQGSTLSNRSFKGRDVAPKIPNYRRYALIQPPDRSAKALRPGLSGTSRCVSKPRLDYEMLA